MVIQVKIQEYQNNLRRSMRERRNSYTARVITPRAKKDLKRGIAVVIISLNNSPIAKKAHSRVTPNKILNHQLCQDRIMLSYLRQRMQRVAQQAPSSLHHQWPLSLCPYPSTAFVIRADRQTSHQKIRHLFHFPHHCPCQHC